MKKIAVIDLLFRNPPAGGAGIDILETFGRLSESFDIRLFYPAWDGPFPRGRNSTESDQPFVPEAVQVHDPTRENVVDAMMTAIDGWAPDLVFVADGWTLKPFIIQACRKRYPTVTRLYAYEMLCPRNNERWLFDKPCNNTVLLDSNQCMDCVRKYAQIVRDKRGPNANALIHEAEAARIWDDDYPAAVRNALQSDAVITYNSSVAGHLKKELGVNATVIPGGVNTEIFNPDDFQKKENSRPLIFIPGRMDDPAKGAATAINAGRILHQSGVDFDMVITKSEQVSYPWLTETGWLSRDELIDRLSKADMVIVPSEWQEAFGMSWAEAMAMKTAVIATDTAGPAEYIEQGKTGLLVPSNDPAALAKAILKLIEDRSLRDSIAMNGYRYAVNHLSWDKVSAMTGETIEEVIKRSS